MLISDRSKLTFVVYAPNVHTGGGFVLLCMLLSELASYQGLKLFLDVRAIDKLVLPVGSDVTWVEPRLVSRFRAELALKSLCAASTTLLCFHGLPPLFRIPSRVVVFMQNRNYLGLNSIFEFSLRTGLRLLYERFVAYFFRNHVDEYIVQTRTMKRLLLAWYGAKGSRVSPSVRVLPLAKVHVEMKTVCEPRIFEWDFIYVADGESHKNHKLLLDAWIQLSREGLRPTLALTLGSRDTHLIDLVERLRDEFGVEIYNLGHLPHDEVLNLYHGSRALIFPSLSESFGLPLVEASYCGTPIVASNLDYVWDVCSPVESFDPNSAHSIALAVRRFLGCAEPVPDLCSPEMFIHTVLDNMQ